MESGSATYKDLENQIAELKTQNEVLKYRSSISKVDGREAYNTSIINEIGDPIFVKDEHSRLLFVNDAFCELFDLTRIDIIGKTLAEDVSEEESESFLKIDKQVILDGVESINEESLTIRSGETQIISTRKRRFIDEDGNIRLIGIIRDITARYNAEKALKVSEAKLIELNSTKDKLFSIIAHDLRNPLHNILGLSELLIEKINEVGDKESIKYLSYIISSAKNTFNLLENLLNWAKSETNQISFNPEKLVFSGVINEIFSLDISLAKAKSMSLNYLTTDEIAVYADENMLKTVLRNLISNAIKFTEPGGRIHINIVNYQDHSEITVSDNGIGITDDKQKRLFNINLNSTSLGTANERGSGLGLVLCKEFVEKHNGSIWVESEHGKGSVFKFTLPFKQNNQ